MWRKMVPTILLLLLIGAAIVAWLRLDSAQQCDKWASITLRKARISYGALRGPAPPFAEYVRALYERDAFEIDGTEYVNPGGCSIDLLPERPSTRP